VRKNQKVISGGKPQYEVIRVLNYSSYKIDQALSIEQIEEIIADKYRRELEKSFRNQSTKTNHPDDK
jgi:hypothetical protein